MFAEPLTVSRVLRTKKVDIIVVIKDMGNGNVVGTGLAITAACAVHFGSSFKNRFGLADDGLLLGR